MHALASIATIVLALALGACGSSFDSTYTIPVDHKLREFEEPEDETILDEAGLLEEQDDEPDETDQPEGGGAPAGTAAVVPTGVVPKKPAATAPAKKAPVAPKKAPPAKKR